MKPTHLSLCSLLVAAVSGLGIFPAWAAEGPDPRQVELAVARLLEQGHYSKKKLDDRFSQRMLKNYLEQLDYNHLYFTQGDVDGFVKRFGNTLDDDILLGNPDAAFTVFEVYKKRVESRMAWAKKLLGEEFSFSGAGTVELNRQKSAWPASEGDADRIWRSRIEGELLQETLNKHKVDPPAKVLAKRYDQVLRYLHEQTNEDVMKTFLNVLALAYDPHSEYMSRSEVETFSINMRLSLVGIGAELSSEDGYAKIQRLIVGGPAAKDGRLKVGDRVAAVAQGEKDFVDAVDMKLDRVVEMIRGKKDTMVRLQVIPAAAEDPSRRDVIEIKRDEIKLKEQEAKAEVIERPLPGGGVQRLGWIVLPSFYADMERSGAPGAKSTTKDVLALLNRLSKEGIEGLVIDLRRNGGGSLEEAVNLTGLFIKKGPVVQSRDGAGRFHVSEDTDSSVAYDGPMVVLTNKLSASASEIFAAALQDYNRAVIVGDSSTFGKGTVQTLLEIGRAIPSVGNGAGALKLTIQKFYRVAGGSTQLKGVEPDVKLPSPFDRSDIGEVALKDPLPYDTVEPVQFSRLERPLFKDELNVRSRTRVGVDPEFSYILEDQDRLKKIVAENQLSLNLQKRQAEIDEEKARKEKRIAERAARKQDVAAGAAAFARPEYKRYAVTLDNASKAELQLVTNEGGKGSEKEGAKPSSDDNGGADLDEVADGAKSVDAVRNESLNILTDLVELSRAGKGPSAANSPRSTPIKRKR